MKHLNEEIIQILYLIFYASLNYIKQGYYEYYLNLQNLVISMIFGLKNNDIDDKKVDLNYIIANYSNKKNEIIINKESEIKEEFCEIYLKNKKIKKNKINMSLIKKKIEFYYYFINY